MGAQLSGLKPTHPGELLREIVFPALKRPKREIAGLLGISRQMLHGILAERHPITPTMALRIGKLLGTSPESWLRMQEATIYARRSKPCGRNSKPFQRSGPRPPSKRNPHKCRRRAGGAFMAFAD
jgi:antitoxin HigA-1